MTFLQSFDQFGLFFSSILAATFFPIGCEPIFVWLITQDSSLTYLIKIILIATVGNTLGSIITYFVGYWFPLQKAAKILRINVTKSSETIEKIKKYGHWMSIFCALLLGNLKVSIRLSFPLIFIGKFLRFLILAFFVLKIKDF